MDANGLREIVNSMTETIPSQCGCRGSGWMLTDFDTRHECPLHYRMQPHPECDEVEEEFPYEATRLRLDREAYVRIRGDAIDHLVAYSAVAAYMGEDKALRSFNQRVKAALTGTTPDEWLRAAQQVAEEIKSEFVDRRPQDQAY